MSRLAALLALLALLAAPPARAGEAAIASAHPLATRAGQQVLAAGGNAFDAAVAVAATLAVVEPYASGLGGGGFFLLHRASDGHEVMVDARETAPGAATVDMYRAADGTPRASSLDGPLAAGIPGLPAGLAHLAERYGRLSLAKSLAPAVQVAREGFPVDARYAGFARRDAERLASGAPDYLDSGHPPEPGWLLRLPRLATTLERLGAEGAAGFYRGPLAAGMVRAVRAGGGIWTEADLAAYRVVERAPTRITYRGARITTASLPSSGGATLAQALHILEALGAPFDEGPEAAHRVIEAMRRAYQDRALHLGDPDFTQPPLARLESPAYARERAAGIRPDRATPSADLGAAPGVSDGPSTTHFSVVDGEGNRVAATLSINTPFGAGFVAGESGVLLNNEMDDFATAPGVPNAYGLVGGAANAVAPGKRPLSSMSPSFVETADHLLVVGSPGGSRIISMVLLATLRLTDLGVADPAALVAAPRFHHQFLPDRVEVEPGAYGEAWTGALAAKGHRVEPAGRAWGNMQAVLVDRKTGRARAASDPRGLAGPALY